MFWQAKHVVLSTPGTYTPHKQPTAGWETRYLEASNQKFPLQFTLNIGKPGSGYQSWKL